MKLLTFSVSKSLSAFLIIILAIACHKEDNPVEKPQDEISIFDQNGKPIAYSYYTDDDTYVIYLWDGTPTSYYTKYNNNELYGFNGAFLGWRDAGVYYDVDGKRIGFEEGALSISTQIEPIKSIKKQLPIKSIQEIAPSGPTYGSEWSSEELQDVLIKGIE